MALPGVHTYERFVARLHLWDEHQATANKWIAVPNFAGLIGSTITTIAKLGGIQIGGVDANGDGATFNPGLFGANGQHVDVKASVLPTGAATAANQATMITSLAAAVVSLAAIDIDTDDLEALIAASNVDLAALEVLATNIETLITASNVDLDALETLVTASNVDLDALETLITASNVDLAALEVLLGTIDADTSVLAAIFDGSSHLGMVSGFDATGAPPSKLPLRVAGMKGANLADIEINSDDAVKVADTWSRVTEHEQDTSSGTTQNQDFTAVGANKTQHINGVTVRNNTAACVVRVELRDASALIMAKYFAVADQDNYYYIPLDWDLAPSDFIRVAWREIANGEIVDSFINGREYDTS